MEKAIAEGGFRLLVSETPCDVTISCKGEKLSGHRLMLSIASPVLQNLLLHQTKMDQTVLILPDINPDVMKLILDYIYSGQTLIPPTLLRDFMDVANLLQLHLDMTPCTSPLSLECLDKVDRNKGKEMADVKPVAAHEGRRGLYNKVFPSPWCPRSEPFPADPPLDPKYKDNDRNNNLDGDDSKAVGKMADDVKVEGDELKMVEKSERTKVEKTLKKEKAFKCEECGKLFSQLRNYKYHRSIHEGTKEFAASCPECGKIFNDRGYLSSHMKIHKDRKEYACPHCPKRFNQRVAYNMHLRIHTGVKPHECSVCGKSFSRKMLLKQHQRVHTGERPYTCPECGKSFADRSNMSLHVRLHTGVKPYTCNVCTKSFTKKHHLKTHMNFHTGLKPYACPKCALAFSQSSNMRTHYKKCTLTTLIANG